MDAASRTALNTETRRVARHSHLLTMGLHGKSGPLLFIQLQPLLEAAQRLDGLLREHGDDYVVEMPEVWGPAMADLLAEHTAPPVPDSPEGLT